MAGKSGDVRCPVCESEAVYKYGHVKTGRQRLKCVLCGRQFVPGFARHEVAGRPVCPQCGNKMHLYMHDNKMLRFRCSEYPVCRSYTKISLEKGGATYADLCS